jgi:hypothetical protein
MAKLSLIEVFEIKKLLGEVISITNKKIKGTNWNSPI